MNRTILAASLLAIGSLMISSDAIADHTRNIRRDYESNRIALGNDYRAKREANTYAYHRNRDLLRAARTRASRIDCRDTRARQLRQINRDLTALSRDYSRANRDIARWYHAERDALRTSYELAMRNARRIAARPVVIETVAAHPADCQCNVCVPVETVVETIVEPAVTGLRFSAERPVYGRTTYSHPADCDCHICEPPARVIEACPNAGYRDGYGSGYGRDYGRYRNDREYERDSYGRSPRALDWASLILSLVN